ncbi:DMT family transporter [Marisediminicola senii]|uniref:DMT family transporter n=1 Tax=Marisediminicola senii TaxID=2711233 RepID=UPI001F222761|nr:DMT family transporter [Marisediminicola senii]
MRPAARRAHPGDRGTRGRGAAGALVVASVLWGTTGTAASLLPTNISPLTTGAATMGVGGLLLAALAPRGSAMLVRDASIRPWVLLGALGVFVYPLAFYSAMQLAGVAVGNVVALGSGPLFAALLEWALERRRPTRRWAAATAAAIVGIAVLASTAHLGAAASNPPLGVGLGLLAGAAYATYSYAASRAMSAGSSNRAVMGSMFGCGALLLLPVFVVGAPSLVQSGLTVMVTAYLIVGPMFVAYLFFGFAIRIVRSSVATTITLLEPVVAAVLAVAIVGERLPPVGWAALALVLCGVLVTALPPGPGARRVPR